MTECHGRRSYGYVVAVKACRRDFKVIVSQLGIASRYFGKKTFTLR